MPELVREPSRIALQHVQRHRDRLAIVRVRTQTRGAELDRDVAADHRRRVAILTGRYARGATATHQVSEDALHKLQLIVLLEAEGLLIDTAIIVQSECRPSRLLGNIHEPFSILFRKTHLQAKRIAKRETSIRGSCDSTR